MEADEAERSFTQDYEDDFDDDEEEASPTGKADASADFEDEFEGSSVMPAASALADSPSAPSVLAQQEDSVSPVDKLGASASFADDFEQESPDATPSVSPEKAEFSRAEEQQSEPQPTEYDRLLEGDPPVSRSLDLEAQAQESGLAAAEVQQTQEEDFTSEEQGSHRRLPSLEEQLTKEEVIAEKMRASEEHARSEASKAATAEAAAEASVSPDDKFDADASFAEDFEEDPPDTTSAPEKAEIIQAEEQQSEPQPTEYDRLLDQASPQEVSAEQPPSTEVLRELPPLAQPEEQHASIVEQTSLPSEQPSETKVLRELPPAEQPTEQHTSIVEQTSPEEVLAERPTQTAVLRELPTEVSAEQPAAVASPTAPEEQNQPIVLTQEAADTTVAEQRQNQAAKDDQREDLIWAQWEEAAQRIGGVWKGSKAWEEMQARQRSLEPPKEEIKAPQRKLKPLRRVASAPSRKLPPRRWVPPDQWDARHHLVGTENEALPKSLRAYFSAPKSLAEVKQALSEAKQDRMVRRLEMEEEPSLHAPPHCSVITADAGPSIMISPGRHRVHHGRMTNHEGQERAWNGRHHVDVYNDGLHPLHRKGFAQGSLFELSKSQRWRRIQDLEVSRGCWNAHSPPVRFPPLGV